jgi:hypothetical protein
MAAEAFAAAVAGLPPRLLNPEAVQRFTERRQAILGKGAERPAG